MRRGPSCSSSPPSPWPSGKAPAGGSSQPSPSGRTSRCSTAPRPVSPADSSTPGQSASTTCCTASGSRSRSASPPRPGCSRSGTSSERSPGAFTSPSTGRSATASGLAMASSAPEGLSPRAREIVAAARELLEEDGVDGLSMRRLADRLGIRAPSIYKHLPDKQALENALVSDGFEEQAGLFEAAVAGTDDPVAAIARAYRDYAHRHPHLYRLMTERALDRERLTPGAEARAAAPVVEAFGGDADRARAAWAFAHGMTILELNDRFPPHADLDAAWARGAEAFRPRPGSK